VKAWSAQFPSDRPERVQNDLDTDEVSTLDARVASFFNPVSWLPDGENLLVVRY
jgi:hypothetical protein